MVLKEKGEQLYSPFTCYILYRKLGDQSADQYVMHQHIWNDKYAIFESENATEISYFEKSNNFEGKKQEIVEIDEKTSLLSSQEKKQQNLAQEIPKQVKICLESGVKIVALTDGSPTQLRHAIRRFISDSLEKDKEEEKTELLIEEFKQEKYAKFRQQEWFNFDSFFPPAKF